MGVGRGLSSLSDLLQLVVPEQLRAPVVEIHVEGAVGRVSPTLRDRSLQATPVRRAMVSPHPHPHADLHLFGKHVGSSVSFGLLSLVMPEILPREEQPPEPPLSLPPSLASERIRIPHEYCWRGAEDSNFSAMATVTYRGISVRIVSHIVSRNTDLAQTSVAAFITKRADLLRHCVRRDRFAPFVVGGYGGDRRPQRVQAWVGYLGEMRAMLDMDF